MKGNWKHGKARKGAAQSKVYRAWRNMLNRCRNPRVPCYPRYGGRGISVCDEWTESFDAFYRDMGDPPEGTSLGRIDNDGDYRAENCRWETEEQQRNNKRSSRFFEFNGERMTLAQWARRLGVTEKLLERRLAIGWSFERAASTPPPARRPETKT